MLDGSFALQLPDRRVDLRVSIAPTTLGEKMVIRILDKNLAPKGLGSLGMDPYILQQVREKTSQETSMLVVCGPTGSGKTTTVYAVLQELNTSEKNIVTVEDPVEYKLQNVTQIQVNPRFNITFASALTSLLRQDPDVILVGEIRDSQTAQMALQSAMTGHLVLSTIHARDSIGSIFRLLDLGVEPFLLGSALSAVLSQRLLRTLCPRCKMKFVPAVKELNRLGLDAIAGTELYAPVGCDKCLGIGYQGRSAIFELLMVNDQVRDAVAHRPTIQELRVAAGDWIFQTLREDAIKKVRAGVTAIDEFKSIAGS
jgi:general secretion pathway protein E